MPTKLNLDYSVLSGPFGNVGIQTRIDDFKREKLPFEWKYFKETPFEVLKFLAKDYNVGNYLNISLPVERGWSFDYKEHSIIYSLSIQEFNQEGVLIKNDIKKNLDLSFIPKRDFNKENEKEDIKQLIRKYLITTHTEYGPTINGLIYPNSPPPHTPSWDVTENYFEDRKTKQNPLKEKQILQIIDYAKIILDAPEFSLNDLENMVLIPQNS